MMLGPVGEEKEGIPKEKEGEAKGGENGLAVPQRVGGSNKLL